MSKFTKEMINEYADKLLIGLSDEENKMVLEEFDEIDRNINLINEIENIDSVEPMTHCLDDFCYELREDVIREVIPVNELMQNCKNTNGEEVIVPKVVG